jgi:GNAT superfamily N-acetyltransferase
MAVTLRHATGDDARAIADVHVAAWRWAYRGQLPDELLEGLSVDDREAMWAASFLDPEDRGAVIVACDDDGQVIGFANAGPSRDEGTPGTTGEVRAIYVVHEVQGKGVGARLLDAVERCLRGVRLRARDAVGPRDQRPRATVLRTERLDLGWHLQ